MVAVRLALISDIHSNYEALAAVFRVLDQMDIDETICLGDIVDYGPNPSACIDLLRTREIRSIQGNHDAAVCEKISLRDFPRHTRKSLKWTMKQLGRDEKAYLAALPGKLTMPWGCLTHGSPHDVLWHYVKDSTAALLIFRFCEDTVTAVGHTHFPGAFSYHDRQVKMLPARVGTGAESGSLALESDCRYILNPGSVGQPRDGDCRASWAVLEIQEEQPVSVTWHRVDYDVERTRQQIYDNRLPKLFGDRLLVGK